MKTKIVYCLVSDPNDYYYEQLLISLCSLRKHNPDVKVEVFCDGYTYVTLKNERSGIFDYGVTVNSVELPSGWDKKERSRYIKTNLRKLVNGNFLFIDVDTVICSSLECVDDIAYDVAAVKDSHVDRPLPKPFLCRHHTECWIWGEAKKALIDIEGLWHFNSGVMFVKDSVKAHELYAKWSSNYMSLLSHGVKIDQLPLLLANNELNNIIAPLDSMMNCQVSFEEGRKMVSKAKIIHYFPRQRKTILSSPWLMDPIKTSGKINPSIQRIIDNPCDFFCVLSEVIKGEKADLLNTPGLCEAHSACPNVFKLWLNGLKLYLAIKKCLYRVVHF